MTSQPSAVRQSARRSPGSFLKDQIARDEPALPMPRFEHTLARLIVRTACRRLTGRSHCFEICGPGLFELRSTPGSREISQKRILNGLRWDGEVIDAVVCGDDVSLGRPAPFLIFGAMERTNVQSVHQVVNVGDTTLDLRAGHNAGVRWNVGVLTGAHDRETLSQAPHTHLIESIAQFPNLFVEV